MSTKARILHLHVKAEYFDAIKSGAKVEEYRLRNAYWRKQLSRGAPPNQFEAICIYRGYPKANDSAGRIMFPYYGFEVRTITHKHFGPSPIEVFAIKLTNTHGF